MVTNEYKRHVPEIWPKKMEPVANISKKLAN